MQPLRVSFSLGERDLAELRQAILRQPPARVRVYRPGEGEVIAEGSLDFVDTSVDVASGTIAARATFGNDDLALWPGQFVDVEIELSVRPQTIMLPTIAIQNGQKGPFVFVVEPDQTVRMRPVQPLASEGDKTALTAGVDRDERIVVEGQLRLVDGARVTESGDAREAVGPAGGRNHATTD
jgi:multidrug efflux system membrane fusion protein